MFMQYINYVNLYNLKMLKKSISVHINYHERKLVNALKELFSFFHT